LLRAEPVRDERGRIVRWYGLNVDIEDRKRAESLLAAETHTLKVIGSGAPLTEILKKLCETIDDLSPQIISTAMLMDPDGERLWPCRVVAFLKGGLRRSPPRRLPRISEHALVLCF
jgi:hypothetical protein